jgi:hypothetical protein
MYAHLNLPAPDKTNSGMDASTFSDMKRNSFVMRMQPEI